MKTLLHNSWKVIFIGLVGIYMSGCANRTPHILSHQHSEKRVEKKQPVAPDSFYIRVSIKDWKIVPHQNKILDGAEEKLGRVRVEGRYYYLDDVVLKLVATNFPMHYWVVKLPQVKDGIYTLKAIKRIDPFYEINKDPSPPKQLNLIVVVKNKKIVDHYLENMRPWWGNFIFSKIDKTHKILYFKNNKFPGYLWACKYTTKNGNYKLDLRLIEEE